MSGRGGSGSTWGHVGSARVRSTSSRVEVDVGTPFKTSCRRSLVGGEGEEVEEEGDELKIERCGDGEGEKCEVERDWMKNEGNGERDPGNKTN